MTEKYYISTGEKSCYYTLRVKTPKWGKDELGRAYVSGEYDNHVKTLSIDREKAIKKASDILGFTPVVSCNPENKISKKREIDWNYLQFGKYQGEKIVDVAKKDKQYLLWAATDFQPKSYMKNVDIIKDILKDDIEKKEKEIAERAKKQKAYEDRIQAEKDAMIDVPEGKQIITGTVISKKCIDSPYGQVVKMLVKDDRNFMIFGTIPSKLCTEYTDDEGYDCYRSPEKNDRVKFTATLEMSSKDKTFGFYKRPTKAEYID